MDWRRHICRYCMPLASVAGRYQLRSADANELSILEHLHLLLRHDDYRSLGRRPGTPFLSAPETLICPLSHCASCSRLLSIFFSLICYTATCAFVTFFC